MDRLRFFLCVVLIISFLFSRSDARPLNPNMKGKKNQTLFFKDQYEHKGETNPGGPRVHGAVVVPLNKGPVPPSAPSPCTIGGIGYHKMSGIGKCPVGA